MNPARLTTYKGVEERYRDPVSDDPIFPASTLRDWASSDTYGFRSCCVVMVGGKAMVDLDALENTWLEERRGARIERSNDNTTPSRPRYQAAGDFDSLWEG